jgi:MFS family permease
MIPFIGLIISDFNYILQAVFMEWNPYWLVLSDIIFGLCGGYISITSTIFSYSMRTTKFEYRSERVAALEGAIGVGSAIGSLISGLIRRFV